VEQGTQLRLESGRVPTTSSVAADAPFRLLDNVRAGANQLGGYSEAELVARRMTITAGVRVDRLPGERAVTFDPRLAVALRAGEWVSRLSAGLFHQGRWRGDVAIPDAGVPSGLPLTARHLVLGVERESSTGLLRAELFAKNYADYRAFGAGPGIQSTRTRGADIIAQRTSGPITGFAGYSWLDATAALLDGRQVRGVFDVTHSATGSVTATIARDWTVGTTLRYGTGAPRTPITGAVTDANGRIQPVHGALMSERLPHYARIDARLMRYIRLPGALLTSYVEIINATDRANVTTYTYDPAYASRSAVHTFFSKRTVVAGAEFMFR
jgi:hypothetical protein